MVDLNREIKKFNEVFKQLVYRLQLTVFRKPGKRHELITTGLEWVQKLLYTPEFIRLIPSVKFVSVIHFLQSRLYHLLQIPGRIQDLGYALHFFQYQPPGLWIVHEALTRV